MVKRFDVKTKRLKGRKNEVNMQILLKKSHGTKAVGECKVLKA
jgi:hypothetical protein